MEKSFTLGLNILYYIIKYIYINYAYKKQLNKLYYQLMYI